MRLLIAIFITLTLSSPSLAADRPVVVELFTSQGCSSCPPADALLGELAEEEGILALTFHVDYWDRLGWKDPFASAKNTARQRAYAKALALSNVFTPQMVIEGTTSAVGSKERQIRYAIKNARKNQPDVPLSLTRDGEQLALAIGEASGRTPLADIWVMHLGRSSFTPVDAGENVGRILTHRNNVLAIKHLGTWQNMAANFTLPLPETDGVAVLLQEARQGRILGAARYLKPAE